MSLDILAEQKMPTAEIASTQPVFDQSTTFPIPLIDAGQTGDAQAVTLLLKARALPSVKWAGQTALSAAARRAHDPVVRLLLGGSSAPSSLLPLLSEAMVAAAEGNHTATLQLLVERHTVLEQQQQQQQDARQLQGTAEQKNAALSPALSSALQHGSYECARLLLQTVDREKAPRLTVNQAMEVPFASQAQIGPLQFDRVRYGPRRVLADGQHSRGGLLDPSGRCSRLLLRASPRYFSTPSSPERRYDWSPALLSLALANCPQGTEWGTTILPRNIHKQALRRMLAGSPPKPEQLANLLKHYEQAKTARLLPAIDALLTASGDSLQVKLLDLPTNSRQDVPLLKLLDAHGYDLLPSDPFVFNAPTAAGPSEDLVKLVMSRGKAQPTDLLRSLCKARWLWSCKWLPGNIGWLVESKADVNARFLGSPGSDIQFLGSVAVPQDGDTPLMLVCRGFPQWRDSHRGGQFETARLEIVRALLAARANVGLSNTEGHTALHVLLSSAFPTGDEGPHEELSALLEAKSDAIKPLSDGQTPLDLLLHDSWQAQQPSRAFRLLRQAGATFNPALTGSRVSEALNRLGPLLAASEKQAPARLPLLKAVVAHDTSDLSALAAAADTEVGKLTSVTHLNPFDQAAPRGPLTLLLVAAIADFPVAVRAMVERLRAADPPSPLFTDPEQFCMLLTTAIQHGCCGLEDLIAGQDLASWLLQQAPPGALEGRYRGGPPVGCDPSGLGALATGVFKFSFDPLEEALRRGNVLLVDRLLEAKATPFVGIVNSPPNLLVGAGAGSQPTKNGQLLELAARAGMSQAVQSLLEAGYPAAEAFSTAKGGGWKDEPRSAVTEGLRQNPTGVLEAVRLLLENKAVPQTAELWVGAVEAGHEPLLRLLMQFGAMIVQPVLHRGIILRAMIRSNQPAMIRLWGAAGMFPFNHEDTLVWSLDIEPLEVLLALAATNPLKALHSVNYSEQSAPELVGPLLGLPNCDVSRDTLAVERAAQAGSAGSVRLLIEAKAPVSRVALAACGLPAAAAVPELVRLLFAQRVPNRDEIAATVDACCAWELNRKPPTVRRPSQISEEVHAAKRTSATQTLLYLFREHKAYPNQRLQVPHFQDDWRQTELTVLMAAASGAPELVSALLAARADVNARSWDSAGSEETALGVCVAAQVGSVENVKLLLAAKADPAAGQPLYRACKAGSLASVEVLLEARADINDTSHMGKTPLCVAARKGHLAVAQYLLKHSADPNRAGDDAEIPVLAAAASGHAAVVDLLLANKASPQPRPTESSLYDACFCPSPACVRVLLEAKANAATKFFERSNLAAAVDSRSTECLKLLLDSKADFTGQLSAAFDHACRLRFHEGLRLLVEAKAGPVERATVTSLGGTVTMNRLSYVLGALVMPQLAAGFKREGWSGPPTIDMSARCASQLANTIRALQLASAGEGDAMEFALRTPLHPPVSRPPLAAAVLTGHTDLCSALLEAKATMSSALGDRPLLEVAVRLDFPDIAALLVKHGAKLEGATLDSYYMRAAYNVSANTVRVLQGLNPSAVARTQAIALAAVRVERRNEVLAVLLQEPGIKELAHRTISACTAITHKWKDEEQLTTLRLLLAAGADVNLSLVVHKRQYEDKTAAQAQAEQKDPSNKAGRHTKKNRVPANYDLGFHVQGADAGQLAGLGRNPNAAAKTEDDGFSFPGPKQAAPPVVFPSLASNPGAGVDSKVWDASPAVLEDSPPVELPDVPCTALLRGTTVPFAVIAQQCPAAVLSELLQHKANPDLRSSPNNPVLALVIRHLGGLLSPEEVAKKARMLLEAKANVTDEQPARMIALALCQQLQMSGGWAALTPLAQALIEHKADPQLLLEVACCNAAPDVARAAIAARADPLTKQHHPRNLLHLVAGFVSGAEQPQVSSIVRLLVEAGVSVNAEGVEGQTPLAACLHPVWLAGTPFVAALVAHKANLDIRVQDARLPLLSTARSVQTLAEAICARPTVVPAELSLVRSLLEAKTDPQTLLCLAVAGLHTAVAELAIRAKANPALPPPLSASLLHAVTATKANTQQAAAVVSLLVKHGASVNAGLPFSPIAALFPTGFLEEWGFASSPSPAAPSLGVPSAASLGSQYPGFAGGPPGFGQPLGVGGFGFGFGQQGLSRPLHGGGFSIHDGFSIHQMSGGWQSFGAGQQQSFGGFGGPSQQPQAPQKPAAIPVVVRTLLDLKASLEVFTPQTQPNLLQWLYKVPAGGVEFLRTAGRLPTETGQQAAMLGAVSDERQRMRLLEDFRSSGRVFTRGPDGVWSLLAPDTAPSQAPAAGPSRDAKDTKDTGDLAGSKPEPKPSKAPAENKGDLFALGGLSLAGTAHLDLDFLVLGTSVYRANLPGPAAAAPLFPGLRAADFGGPVRPASQVLARPAAAALDLPARALTGTARQPMTIKHGCVEDITRCLLCRQSFVDIETHFLLCHPESIQLQESHLRDAPLGVDSELPSVPGGSSEPLALIRQTSAQLASSSTFFLTANPRLARLLQRGRSLKPPRGTPDTAMHILSFLSCGSLLRFSQVCASWFALASSTDSARLERHWTALYLAALGLCKFSEFQNSREEHALCQGCGCFQSLSVMRLSLGLPVAQRTLVHGVELGLSARTCLLQNLVANSIAGRLCRLLDDALAPRHFAPHRPTLALLPPDLIQQASTYADCVAKMPYQSRHTGEVQQRNRHAEMYRRLAWEVLWKGADGEMLPLVPEELARQMALEHVHAKRNSLAAEAPGFEDRLSKETVAKQAEYLAQLRALLSDIAPYLATPLFRSSSGSPIREELHNLSVCALFASGHLLRVWLRQAG